MTDFHPRCGMLLHIGSSYYDFMPDPLFPDDEREVSMIEGGEARIYQVRDLARNSLYALKVTKRPYRGEHIIRSAALLGPLRKAPGLYLGHRICLTKARYPELISSFPALEYAVLMPWIPIPPWRTWAGLMYDGAASARYNTPSQARALAQAMAQVLWYLRDPGVSACRRCWRQCSSRT